MVDRSCEAWLTIAVPVGAQRTVVQALDAHGNAALVQFDIIRRGVGVVGISDHQQHRRGAQSA